MIPKKIHYFWFGRGEKPTLVKHCIESWKKIQPDFEIIEWTEDNFDVNQTEFSKKAYENKKWAYVSDFARAKILFEHGGFYLDTDMELKLPLNEFLENQAICGFEMKGVPYSAFWGVEKKHELAKDILEYYQNKNTFEELPNTKIFSELLVKKYGANADKDIYQELEFGIKLFPSTYFSLDLPKNYITHHFSGSWHGAWSEHQNTFKNLVNTYGIMKLFSDIPNAKPKVKDVVYNHKKLEIDEILNQIPFSYIVDYVKKEILKKLKLK